MKIAFFTESSFEGKYPRDYSNTRTEIAWMITLDATHHHFAAGQVLLGYTSYDLGIVIIPKKNPQWALKELDYLKKVCKKLAIMQEGPNWLWQDWDVPTQVDYYNALCNVDYLFVHNFEDIKYYKGLTNHPKIYVLPSLMIEDTVKQYKGKHGDRGVMIGGNFTSWYGGFDSLIVAQQLDTLIQAPSMGRKQPHEEQLVHHLPYLQWTDWIEQLSKVKYGVHMMRTHAAGTFALNCSFLSLPCVGYHGLDTQEVLHPLTTVENLAEARVVANRLRTDENFYLECSTLTTKLYDTYYTEEGFLKKFKHIINGEEVSLL